MNRSTSLFTLLPVALLLAGCSGSSAPGAEGVPTTQSFGPLTTRIVGAAQAPVTSSAANGANVTGIAGALVDQLTLNLTGPGTLSDTKLAFSSGRDGNNEIYSMNADGTNPTNLTNNLASDSAPSWSSDGTKLAFVSNRDGNAEIYSMNADGSGQTRLTNNAASDSNPSWSPDGTKIAFRSGRDGNDEIYGMNADGSGQTRLTNNAAFDDTPSWSPDGSKIAFNSSRDGNQEIYLMNADGSSPTRLTNNAAFDFLPSWSPDGTKLAFSSSRDGNFEIYGMNADGSGQTRLTTNSASDFTPSWSPDGTKLAFYSQRDGNFEIYSVSSSGGLATNLSKQPSSGDDTPSWSGYLPRTPKTLVGAGRPLGTAAAGFLYAQKAGVIRGVVTFDTSTVGSRAGARVVSQTATETQGSDILFSITTAGLASVKYVKINEAGVPGAAIVPTIPAGSTGALVNFVATDGNVSSIIPYAANRAASLTRARNGYLATYTGHFTAVFDGEGKNLAPRGARTITLNEKTGRLVNFE